MARSKLDIVLGSLILAIIFAVLIYCYTPEGWEEWSYFAVIIGVIINAGFLFALILQIRQGRKAVVSAEESANAAILSVKETSRTRIDNIAPRVVAVLDKESLGAITMDGNKPVWAVENNEYVLLRDGELKVYFTIKGSLKNEGKSTAYIGLNGYVELAEEQDDDINWIPGPIDAHFIEVPLGPGERIYFKWSDSHTVNEWASAHEEPSPKGSLRLIITARDAYEEGVVDYIYLEMSGQPLKPKADNSASWELVGGIGISYYPTHRVYKKEVPVAFDSPWLKSDEDWYASQQVR